MFSSQRKDFCCDRGCECCRDLSENVHCTYISNIKRSKPSSDSNTPVDQKKKRLHNSSATISMEKRICSEKFSNWSGGEQVDFICNLLSKVSHFQQSQINAYLEPLLKRDFVVALQSRGVPYLAEMILVQLDAPSLLSAELVSRGWQWSVAKYQLWRRLIALRIASDPVWHGLCERRNWLEFVNLSDPTQLPVLLERRRISFGLRHKSCDFPMFHDGQYHSQCCDVKSHGNQQLPFIPSCQYHARPVITSNELNQHIQLSSPQTLIQRNCENDKCSVPCCSVTSYTTNEISQRVNNVSSSFSLDTEIRDIGSYESVMFAHRFYKQLYPRIIRDIARVEDNWARCNYHLTRISCRSEITKGVYCLQYDKEKIVSGLRDNTIKVWKRVPSVSPVLKATGFSPESSKPLGDAVQTNHECVHGDRSRGDGPLGTGAPTPANAELGEGNQDNYNSTASSDAYQCTQVLKGHSGSVLCLQYIGNLLISGSSDTTVQLWDLSTGCRLNVICHHAEAVLHLRFRNNVLVTCSKDRSIAVWDMGPWPKDVQLRQVLVGHRAAVNVVDFDEKYIVSASGDRTIKVWATATCAYVRTLSGHRRGIACLQYRDRLVVSGSSDNTIRIWDIESGVCFRVLEGHEELVRCIRFDSKRIVSGAYDGKVKVWSLKAALNPRSKPNQLCIHTLQQHTGRVFRLQFDDFQIVSSSHDDTILIWDFARPSSGSEELDDGFDDGINAALASQNSCLCALRSAAAQSQVSPENSNSKISLTNNIQTLALPSNINHSIHLPVTNSPVSFQRPGTSCTENVDETIESPTVVADYRQDGTNESRSQISPPENISDSRSPTNILFRNLHSSS